MSWYNEWTSISQNENLDDFSFFERTGRGPKVNPPLNLAPVGSWVVGGQRGGGPVMVEQLPVEVKQVRGLPIYYDQANGIWFVDGYSDNFVRLEDAVAYAESLVPAEVTEPPPQPSWIVPLAGLGLIALLLV